MITYTYDQKPDYLDVIELYKASRINRPIEEPEKIQTMVEHSNLIITAWENDKLIGIARALTDFVYACYLSDLAVHPHYQNQGVGSKLIHLLKENILQDTMLFVLAAPNAMEYYPKLDFELVENGFIIKRKF